MERLADGFKGQKAIVIPNPIRQQQRKNEITRQLYVTHIGYYPNAKHHYYERSDGAAEYILIYCTEGSGWVKHNNNIYSVRRNQAFIIPANESHSYGADNKTPWSIYWIHFNGSKVNMFASTFARVIVLEQSEKSRIKDRLQLFEEISQNLEMGYSSENLEYVSFCMMHFLASIKYINQFRELNNIKIPDIIQRSILFMKNNLENRITFNDIADHVGYSTSHLGALFHERTSFSPMEYYNQLKIQRACSYLQFSDLKIKEIAFRLGYFDPFHFSKSFHKAMETTPSKYRNKYMKVQTIMPV